MEKDKKQISVNKIEIGDNAEPIIVPASEKDISEEIVHDKKVVEQYEAEHSIGKQLKMSSVFVEDKSIEKRQLILKRVVTILFFVVVFGVLAYTFYDDFLANPEPVSWTAIFKVLGKNWYYGVFALVSLALCYLFKGTKMSILCKTATGKWHFNTCMQTGVVGHYYNYVTPLAVGGQPFEIYHLSKHGVTGGAALSLPVVTYFMHQVVFVILGVISLVLFSIDAFMIVENFKDVAGAISLLYAMAIIGLGLCLLTPVGVLLFCSFPNFASKVVGWAIRLGGKLRFIKDVKGTTEKTVKNLEMNAKCIKKISRTPLAFWSSITISFLEHLALCSIAYFALKLFGYDLAPNPNGMLEWVCVIVLSMIIYSAVSFIPTPGNAGAADLSFFALFKSCILPCVSVAGISFIAMIFWRILSYYAFIIIGFVLLRRWKKKDRKNQEKNLIDETI